MWLERISGGGAGLVGLDAAKAHLRILSYETDDEVQAAIAAASAYLDVDGDGFGGLGFPMVAQTWSSKARCFSPSLLRLPFARVTAVSEIRYTAPDGTPGVVPSVDYMMTRAARATVVTLLPGKSWPNLIDRPDAVDLRFAAGFANVAAVPGDIVEAAKQLISFYFHNRGADASRGVSEEVAQCVDRLTVRYRRFAA